MDSTSQETQWGTIKDRPVKIFTISNKNGLILKATEWGCIITELHLPDRTGKFDDVVLGFDSLDAYMNNGPYFGAIVGRCANRIANGRFSIDGVEYSVATNDGPHHLHGGVRGFDKQLWPGELVDMPAGRAIRFKRKSPDGEEGYPGNLWCEITYTLTDSDELHVDMVGMTDKPTLCNLAQHSYFNLAGHAATDVYGHELTIYASRYTVSDDKLIPTGIYGSVDGTPMDFRVAKPIGRDILKVRSNPPGYDDNFVIDGDPHSLRLVAEVCEPTTGRTMSLRANQPGCQLYTGNFLDGTLAGKGGARYARHGAFCLETQHHPNAVNLPDFPSPILRPGKKYDHKMVYAFGVK